jgi:hypothetical protein
MVKVMSLLLLFQETSEVLIPLGTLRGSLVVGDGRSTLYEGTTKTVRLMDFTFVPADPDNVPSAVTSMTTGEIVAISILDKVTGATVVPPVTASNGGGGDDWYAVVTLPAAGRYRAKARAVKNGAIEVFYASISVKAAA